MYKVKLGNKNIGYISEKQEVDAYINSIIESEKNVAFVDFKEDNINYELQLVNRNEYQESTNLKDQVKDNKNIVFKIYNTYKGKIDIEKVGTGYTSKGKGHGYGLRLVKDIINENKVFDISHDLEDNYFVSSLYIKK